MRSDSYQRTKYLVINQTQEKNEIYCCWAYQKHHYVKYWLNGYDLIGLSPFSKFLFDEKQLKMLNDYLAHGSEKDPEAYQGDSIPLDQARIQAGQTIQKNMK